MDVANGEGGGGASENNIRPPILRLANVPLDGVRAAHGDVVIKAAVHTLTTTLEPVIRVAGVRLGEVLLGVQHNGERKVEEAVLTSHLDVVDGSLEVSTVSVAF